MFIYLKHFNTHVKQEIRKTTYICIYLHAHICVISHLTRRCFMWSLPGSFKTQTMPGQTQLTPQVQSAHTASSKVDIFIARFWSRCCLHLSIFPAAGSPKTATIHCPYQVLNLFVLCVFWGCCNTAGPCAAFIRAATEYNALDLFNMAQQYQEKKATMPWIAHVVTISATARTFSLMPDSPLILNFKKIFKTFSPQSLGMEMWNKHHWCSHKLGSYVPSH